jgi:ATP-dependent helicase/nuclease subunit A
VSIEKILAELDGDQIAAATAEVNAVVAAGAGAGKTKVLASRYAWLVMERGLRVEEILTLTFTNKAVNEMYSRIYGILAGQRDNERARRAVQDFHKANISTIDSFCTGIARTAARRYGVAGDFTNDNDRIRELALDAALPFVLDHRQNPALQALMAEKKIKVLAEELFVEPLLNYSPLSSPLDPEFCMEAQGKELLRQWNLQTRQTRLLLEQTAGELAGLSGKKTKLYEALKENLSGPLPEAPAIETLLEESGFLRTGTNEGDTRETRKNPEKPEKPEKTGGSLRRELASYFETLFKIKSISLSGRHAEEYRIIKENLGELKNKRYGDLASLANMALGSDVTAEVFSLVAEFQDLFNQKKRQAGLLSFNDIARLAVDALAAYPEIRQVYKDAIQSIMVDEFQDNNRLQRNLIFLLAEKTTRQSPGVPPPEELRGDKMFFVGDEKQSIYRFRGADVSVFRGLARDLAAGPGGTYLNLRFNYRSKPALIDAFNRIFGGPGEEAGAAVFPRDTEEALDFEARYSRVYAPPAAAAGNETEGPVIFCFLDESRLDRGDPRGLSTADLEAAFIAQRIRAMVDGAWPIQTRDQGVTGSRPCAYRDFAVLQRSYTHQGALEKQLKNFSIPFTADRPAGLFTDAPVNDLYNLLRLLVYPGDRVAYAGVLRSPFVRLNDLSLTLCLLDQGPPFNEGPGEGMSPGERERYHKAGTRYQSLREAARTLPLSKLITRLWYTEGYRYETIWSPASRVYGELYDLFFETARKAEDRGQGLADFLDYLGGLISRDEKLDDPDLPAGGEPGVRLMSIHKSKGLEFPVVFVYRAGGGGQRERNSKSVYFSEEWGLTLNLPPAEELPGEWGNYFFNRQKEAEEARAEAELRRLLYVAMTRAESLLLLTATLPRQTREEADAENLPALPYTEDTIRRRLLQLAEKNREGTRAASFLDLLLPVFAAGDIPGTLAVIPVYSRDELRRLAAGASALPSPRARRNMEAAAKYAAPFYEAAKSLDAPRPGLSLISASSLHYAAGEDPAPAASPPEGDALDQLLRRTDMDAADFGTLVHAWLEAQFRGQKPRFPPEILAGLDEKDADLIRGEARNLAGHFMESPLGRMAAAAAFRETEFPFLTGVELPGGVVHVSGKIDLLFEAEGTLHIVDFKTDRLEAPRRHWAQLAVYERAVQDLFQKPVRSWLFYLRGSHAVELTGSLGEADIEALVDAARFFIRSEV